MKLEEIKTALEELFNRGYKNINLGNEVVSVMPSKDEENIENYTYTFTFDSAATGRYVKIQVMSPVYCLQFDEILVLSK